LFWLLFKNSTRNGSKKGKEELEGKLFGYRLPGIEKS